MGTRPLLDVSWIPRSILTIRFLWKFIGSQVLTGNLPINETTLLLCLVYATYALEPSEFCVEHVGLNNVNIINVNYYTHVETQPDVH